MFLVQISTPKFLVILCVSETSVRGPRSIICEGFRGTYYGVVTRTKERSHGHPSAISIHNGPVPYTFVPPITQCLNAITMTKWINSFRLLFLFCFSLNFISLFIIFMLFGYFIDNLMVSKYKDIYSCC